MNGISDFCYGSHSVGLRCSIEHCEIDGFMQCLSQLWRYIYDIARNNWKNNININILKRLIIAIDNETVVKWVVGKYYIEELIVYDKIKSIHNMIEDFMDFDINIDILWQKAHCNEPANEAADDLAKLAMLN